MKVILIVFALMFAGLVQAATWVELNSQRMYIGQPNIPGVINPTDQQLLDNDWRILPQRAPDVSNGYVRLSVLFIQDPVIDSNAIETYVDEEERPLVFDRGIEIPYGALLVIPAETNNIGYAIFVDDAGSLFTVQVHASPWLSKTQIMAEASAKIAANNVAATNSVSSGDQARSDAAAASSVAELREAVDLMQDQIDELQRILNIRQ